MQDPIIELEKKIAFIDHKVEELNEVIIDQAKTIEELKNQIKIFQDQLDSDELVRKIEDEEPPPHY